MRGTRGDHLVLVVRTKVHVHVFCELLSLLGWVLAFIMLLVQMSRAASNVMIAVIYLCC